MNSPAAVVRRKVALPPDALTCRVVDLRDADARLPVAGTSLLCHMLITCDSGRDLNGKQFVVTVDARRSPDVSLAVNGRLVSELVLDVFNRIGYTNPLFVIHREHSAGLAPVVLHVRTFDPDPDLPETVIVLPIATAGYAAEFETHLVKLREPGPPPPPRGRDAKEDFAIVKTPLSKTQALRHFSLAIGVILLCFFAYLAGASGEIRAEAQPNTVSEPPRPSRKKVPLETSPVPSAERWTPITYESVPLTAPGEVPQKNSSRPR